MSVIIIVCLKKVPAITLAPFVADTVLNAESVTLLIVLIETNKPLHPLPSVTRKILEKYFFYSGYKNQEHFEYNFNIYEKQIRNKSLLTVCPEFNL